MTASATTVLVGGVSQLYAGDLDLGRVVVEQLAGEHLGRGTLVEDLHYGAVTVAQRLQELRPHTLVLVGAEVRGRAPATLQRRRVAASAADAQTAVAEAVQGYVGIDLVVDVAAGLGALPPRVVAIELEPVTTDTALELSPAAQRALPEVLRCVRLEACRAPLFALVDDLHAALADAHLPPTAALEALEALLDQLAGLDADGRWGRTFTERDRLRAAIAEGATGEGMTHLDWGLWWALVEELDRLQRLEAAAAG